VKKKVLALAVAVMMMLTLGASAAFAQPTHVTFLPDSCSRMTPAGTSETGSAIVIPGIGFLCLAPGDPNPQ
jgi:hypothetical protein